MYDQVNTYCQCFYHEMKISWSINDNPPLIGSYYGWIGHVTFFLRESLINSLHWSTLFYIEIQYIQSAWCRSGWVGHVTVFLQMINSLRRTAPASETGHTCVPSNYDISKLPAINQPTHTYVFITNTNKEKRQIRDTDTLASFLIMTFLNCLLGINWPLHIHKHK